MAKPFSPSFRRILLSRLFLLSIPVLIVGMLITASVTYRKARSALLKTARQNLTESAMRKAERLAEEIAALKANFAAASTDYVLVAGQSENYTSFLQRLSEQLPTEVECLQLIEAQTQKIAATTCGSQPLFDREEQTWPASEQQLPASDRIRARVLLPSSATAAYPSKSLDTFAVSSKLALGLETPIYDRDGNLSHILALETVIVQSNQTRPGSLKGSTLVIDDNQTILLHPDSTRIGRNIKDEMDAVRLESILRNAFDGRNDFLHLEFEAKGESLAGYTAIPNPLDPNSDSQWAVLAITRLNDALAALWEIQRTLLVLLSSVTLSLICASFLAIFYLSRELARPLERLRDYARDEENLYSDDQVPQNLKIREFNELASALNRMVKRLKAWAMELEAAWKEAQAANQLKSEFLTTISHELRTPLNGIIGSIRLIKDGFCDDREEEIEFLEQADRAAVHLLSIIDDILDISKIESGQLTVILETIDFAEVLAEAVAIGKPTLEEKGLKLVFSPPDCKYPVQADPGKLKQVFCNIIDNAVKFTKAGQVSISVGVKSPVPALMIPGGGESALPSTSAPQQAIATIEDTGIGIAPDQMDKLFRPFVMVDGSTTREAGGTGLGLALSRNFIELMGGTVILTSPGKDRGTTVTISLPLIS